MMDSKGVEQFSFVAKLAGYGTNLSMLRTRQLAIGPSIRALMLLLLRAGFMGLTALCLGAPQNTAAPGETVQVQLSEILIPLTPSASSEEIASTWNEAQNIIDQLNAGASFEEEAREHSKGPTAAQGGDVGYFARGVLPLEIEQKVFNLKVRTITNPIRTKQGLVIMKVTDRLETAPNSSYAVASILTDVDGVDVATYLPSVMQEIRMNWYSPHKARSSRFTYGAVTIVFSIRKDGVIKGMKILTPSGDSELDRSVWQAIEASSPLTPLPSKFRNDLLTIRFRFNYNLKSMRPN